MPRWFAGVPSLVVARVLGGFWLLAVAASGAALWLVHRLTGAGPAPRALPVTLAVAAGVLLLVALALAAWIERRLFRFFRRL